MVARNVEQLKGQLRVESQVGEGSRFSCLIPLALPGIPDRCKNEPGTSYALPNPSQPSEASNVQSVDVDRDVHELLNTISFSQGSTSNVPSMAISKSDRFVADPPGPSGAWNSPQSAAELQSRPQLRVLVVDVSPFSVLTASYVHRIETG